VTPKFGHIKLLHFRKYINQTISRGNKPRALVGVSIEDGRVLLLGGNHTDLAGEGQSALEHVVGHDIKLLLLLTLNVDGATAAFVTDLSQRPCQNARSSLQKDLGW